MEITYENYDAILAIDTNVILECQPLEQLKWGIVNNGKKILLIVAPQVVKEVDKRKRDGRLQQRARNFNRILGSFLSGNSPVQLVEKGVTVDIAAFNVGTIDWAAFDLDPQEADQKIIGQLLHVPGVEPSRITFVGYDFVPLAIAKSKGFSIFHIPGEWLTAPEASPHEKELSKLKEQVKIFGQSEPIIDLGLDFFPDDSLEVWDIEKATDEEVQTLVAKAKMVSRRRGGNSILDIALLSTSLYDVSDSDIDKYNNKLPKIASRLNDAIMSILNQFKISLKIENKGPLSAQGLQLEVAASEAFTHTRCMVSAGWPPPQPQPSPFSPPYLGSRSLIDSLKAQPSDEFVDKDDDKLVSLRRISCGDFRQERKEVLSWFGLPSATANEVTVSCRITFANKKGVSEISKTMPLIRRRVSFAEAYDIQSEKYLLKPYITNEIHQLLKNKLYRKTRYPND